MRYETPITKKEMLCGKEIEVDYVPGVPGKTRDELLAMMARGERPAFFNFSPVLEPGSTEVAPGIICDRDTAIKMRDGVTIYADIYRPTGSEKVPVIVSWSPFGKRQSESMGDWKLMGVAPGTVSPMAKFESPDPAYWCRIGYAVANVDPRGVGNSEGDANFFGLQDGEDAYDFTEWCAVQTWCNGKVGFTGNSGVAMSCWRAAAAQPPHLACIAPWEGTGDHYRESMCAGGIRSDTFHKELIVMAACPQMVENASTMLDKHPYYDEYWQSKTPDWNKIRIPVYAGAGWCHFHLRGSIEGFRRIRTPKKWLRIHREYEWPDFYNKDNLEDLTKFFDRYLKDIHNGWESTPKVRLDVMDSYSFDLASKRPEENFPIPRTQYKKLYLNAANATLNDAPVAEKAEITNDPTDAANNVVVFDYKFEEDTEISGYMKLHLYCEARGHDNMDLFVWVKKLNRNGEYVPVHCIHHEPYRGAWGYCRVSRRELDEELSSDFQPVQKHARDLKLSPGEIAETDVEIWPHSRFWRKGETLRVEISGHFIRSEWFEDGRLGFETDNGNGIHVFHTGAEHESFLQIPVIPPKFQDGDYIVR